MLVFLHDSLISLQYFAYGWCGDHVALLEIDDVLKGEYPHFNKSLW